MSIENTNNKKPRPYHRITPRTVAEFKVKEIEHGNGSAAIRALNPTLLKPSERAYRIRKKKDDESTLDFIDSSLQQIGVDAVQRVGKLVNSVDERVATRNAHYVIDHIRGQAVRRTESKHLQVNIETVLQ